MGDSLAGAKPSTNFSGLVKTTDNAVIDTAERQITDGAGNDTGLGLSSTKVFANKLVLKTPAASTTDIIALVRASDGSVLTRQFNPQVFAASLQNRFIARTASTQVSPLTFSEVGAGATASISLSTDMVINGTSNAIEVAGAGAVVKITASVKLTFTENDSVITLNILSEADTLATLLVPNPTSTGGAVTIVTFSTVHTTTTADDEIKLTYAATSGTVAVSVGTFLDIEKLT